MTRAHNDRIIKDGGDKGYSIRVGKKLPHDSANLAYVHTPPIKPTENLMITDLSDKINENGLPSTYKTDKTVFPDDDFLLRELSGESRLPTNKIALTDEFSIPSTAQDKPMPLYYMATTKGRFDAKGSIVSPYSSGYLEAPPEKVVDYASLSFNEQEELIYLGTKIRITRLDGTALSANQKYKVHLVKESGEGVPENAYAVYIYTNFKNSKNDTFVIRYEKYNDNGTHASDTVEVLNAYPFFDELPEEKFEEMQELAKSPKDNGEWREELTRKEYIVLEAEDNTYQVYAPSQVAIANNQTRPAHQFKYRVSGNLKTKYAISNPGTINIGIAYLNNSVYGDVINPGTPEEQVINVENLIGTLKKVHEDGLRPKYLDFNNPHNDQLSLIKENSRYWSVDLGMPADYYDDYDLIIITGYGFYDMSKYNDSIRRYLQNGGKIWIDNAGSGNNVLSFTDYDGRETFLTNIGFSKTQDETGFKVPGTGEKTSEFLGRLYILNSDNLKIGYENTTRGIRVNPKITFGAGESPSQWQSIVDYSTTKPSVIYRAIEEKGEILVSNCGVFRSLYYTDDEKTDTKFAINAILTFAENAWETTPWIADYVYHRDNLFKEEYNGVGNDTYYIDDRSDKDASQIVSKKVVKKGTREALLPYLQKGFYNAKGSYLIEVESNNELPVTNNGFEIGFYDDTLKQAVDTWTTNKVNAIAGWSTSHQAGSTPEFKHVSSFSQRGTKAIQVTATDDGTGSHSYWMQQTGQIVGGSYKVTVWVKSSNLKGISEAISPIGVYTIDGTKISTSTVLLGTRDWIRMDVNFAITTAQKVEIRLGFVNGNGAGTIMFDSVALYSIGSVYATPNEGNDGSLPLYFYAVKPRGDAFDIQSQGFRSGDITTYDPELTISYTVRAFVYTWDNTLGRYMREYGNFVTQTRKIRRSDGIISLGALTTMLPPLNAGDQWADLNKIYYEIFMGGSNGADQDSHFVNLSIYNTETGQYYFTKAGERVIRYRDIFTGSGQKNIIVQASTGYYTIRATKRRYGLRVESDDKIQLAYPSTIDDRDCWFLRIKNGSFKKDELGYNELMKLKMYDARYYEFQQRLFGTHYYSIPEYKRQVFAPKMGIKRVRKEIAEYVNDKTIKVQDSPLYVLRGSVTGEMLEKIDAEGRIFKSNYNGWLQNDEHPVNIYVDENMDGNYIEWSGDRFDIDHSNGYVIFDIPPLGTVKADYSYNNISVYKRAYNNAKIRNEDVFNIDDPLVTTDKKVFSAHHNNWLSYPAPVVKIVPFGATKETIVPVTSYTIDYENGWVIFNEDVHDRVVVDYYYSTDTELKIKDYDAQNGLIYLEKGIDFKDEVYVNYYYEENYFEYRGYYDNLAGRFIHLDLNPSEGHYCTIPVAREDETTGTVKPNYEEVPTGKLLNKEVYVYIIPSRNSFGHRNEQTVKHCYSLAEWNKIQKVDPTALLLGVVHIRSNSMINDAIVLDTRTRGGGLKENISENQILKTQPLSMNHWDMGAWDGKAYYKNGVVIIQVPRKILVNDGGQFTEEQVTDIVKKYIAYGIYYIIEYI